MVAGKKKIEEHIALPWFKSQEFAVTLMSKINCPTSGICDGFSMRTGYVFFYVETVYEALRVYALKSGWRTIEMYNSTDRKKRQSILMYVVRRMIDDGVVPRELLIKGFFCGKFRVHFRDCEPKDFFFIPFNSTAFVDNILFLEKGKFGRLLHITKVVPLKKKTDW